MSCRRSLRRSDRRGNGSGRLTALVLALIDELLVSARHSGCPQLPAHGAFRAAGALRAGLLLLGGLAVGVLVGNVCLKNFIARPRPCWLDSSVRLLIADPTDYSFPSGHTLSSVIGATILTKTDRRFGYAAIPLAALIAFSRLYLYVHFPSDVLAAAVLGVMIGELAFYADRRWTERRGT